MFCSPPVPVGRRKRGSSCQTSPQNFKGDSHRLGIWERCGSWAIVVLEVFI
jgi:hypothetical protein